MRTPSIVRLILPPAKLVLSVGASLDGIGDGGLVRVCHQPFPGTGKAGWAGDVLVGAGAVV